MSEMKDSEVLEIKKIIPVQNLEAVRNKIAILNKRAKKLNLPEITLSFGKRSSVIVKHFDLKLDIPMIECLISGTYPRLPGYKFVAKLEKVGDRNMVLGLDGDIDETWITMPSSCDHCKSKRSRKETFLIRKEDTGKILQIGSNCVDEFIGRDSIEAIAMRAELLRLFGDEGLFDMGFGDDPEKLPKVVATEDFIACSIAAIRKYGFVSKNSATTSLLPTATAAFARLVPILPEKAMQEMASFEVTNVDFEMATLGLSKVDDLLRDYFSPSLAANIKTVCSSPDLHMDHIFTSVLFGKLILDKSGFDTKTPEKEKPEVIIGKYLGSVGDKIVANVTVEKKMNFDSSYNESGVNMILMRDEAGNTLSTMTGGLFNPDIGSKVQIKGTVKGHKEYKTVKQTTLQRVSILKCQALEDLKKALADAEFKMSYVVDPEKKCIYTGDINFDLDEVTRRHNIEAHSDLYFKLRDIEQNPVEAGFFQLSCRSPSSKKEDLKFKITKSVENNQIFIMAKLVS